LTISIFSEFTLEFKNIGCFKHDGGDTWWIGFYENKSLLTVQADLFERLKQKGFALENRHYTPHVTIGREVKMPARFVLPNVRQDSFTVTSIELMKSERINGKLVYAKVFSKKYK